MIVNEILHKPSTLTEQCSTFLREAGENPLLKMLPTKYNDFHRVKIRVRKSSDAITSVFNEAFNDKKYNILLRSVTAHGARSFLREYTIDTEPFYIFPINGYKFLYNKEINKLTEHTFDSLVHDTDTTLLQKVMQFTYSSTSLLEGMQSDAEVVIYDIPYYLAIRASIGSYKQIINNF